MRETGLGDVVPELGRALIIGVGCGTGGERIWLWVMIVDIVEGLDLPEAWCHKGPSVRNRRAPVSSSLRMTLVCIAESISDTTPKGRSESDYE